MVKTKDILCYKHRGGENTIWVAYHPTIGRKLIGTGVSADYAIKDWKNRYKRACKQNHSKEVSMTNKYGEDLTIFPGDIKWSYYTAIV